MNWSKYLVKGEPQRKDLETMGCLSFSGTKIVAMHIMKMIEEGNISDENLEWLQVNGYFDTDGQINFSDRHLAKASNTQKYGNYGSRVARTIEEVGLVPESMWAFLEDYDWDEYYVEIEELVESLATEFAKRFLVQGHRVHHFKWEETLEKSPIQIYISWYGEIKDGIYQKTTTGIVHATVLYKLTDIKYTLDSYKPFLKKLSGDYMHYAYGYWYSVTEKHMPLRLIKEKGTPHIYALGSDKTVLHIGTMSMLVAGSSIGLWKDTKDIEEMDCLEFSKYEKRTMSVNLVAR